MGAKVDERCDQLSVAPGHGRQRRRAGPSSSSGGERGGRRGGPEADKRGLRCHDREEERRVRPTSGARVAAKEREKRGRLMGGAAAKNGKCRKRKGRKGKPSESGKFIF